MEGTRSCFGILKHKNKPASPPPSPPPADTQPPPPLSHQIQGSHDLRQVFDKVDADGDSRISASELESVLPALGTGEDPRGEALSMMREADLNGDGYIGFDEFVSVNRSASADDTSCVDDLRRAFTVYDADGDGLISSGELHCVLNGVAGEKGTTMEECEGMIRAVDGDGDGAVSFEEFVRLMKRSIA